MRSVRVKLVLLRAQRVVPKLACVRVDAIFHHLLVIQLELLALVKAGNDVNVKRLHFPLLGVAGFHLLVLVESEFDELVKQLLNMQEHALGVDEPEELLLLRGVRKDVVEDLRIRRVVAGNYEAESGHLGPDLVYRDSHGRPDLLV